MVRSVVASLQLVHVRTRDGDIEISHDSLLAIRCLFPSVLKAARILKRAPCELLAVWASFVVEPGWYFLENLKISTDSKLFKLRGGGGRGGGALLNGLKN